MTTALPRSISFATDAMMTARSCTPSTLIELNGDDLRRDALEVRKATLASIVAKASPGIRFNEHTEGDGPTIFAHACKMALEGIVSKAKGLPLSFRPFARLAQNEERECTGREAGRGRGLGAPRNPIILDAALGPHEALNRAR